MATIQNADWYCGESVMIRITIAGEGSIAGYTFAATVTPTYGKTAAITKASGDGLSIHDPDLRIIEITMEKADSEDLRPGGYVWDVWRTDDGFETCLTSGKIELKPRATVLTVPSP